MMESGRWLIFVGLMLALTGVIVLSMDRLGYRGLHLHLESERFRVYIPLGTCLAISALLSLFYWIWRFFERR